MTRLPRRKKKKFKKILASLHGIKNNKTVLHKTTWCALYMEMSNFITDIYV